MTSSKQEHLVLLISIFATFVAFLDGSIINVALPAIAHELGGGLTLQEWVVNAYLITLGTLMLLAGSLSDLFGRKKILIIGLVGFALTSLLCAVAPNGLFLILARGLQGMAGALLVPSSLALIIATFSGPRQAKAIGTWTAWTVIGPALGPVLGGLLVDTLSWRFIFAVNLIPIAIALWFMRSLASESHPPRTVKIDAIGALLSTLSLGGVVFGLIEQPHFGWSSPLIYLPFFGGIGLFMIFLWYERYHPHPILPLSLFNVRNFSIGNLATVTIYAALSVAMFLITIFIQQVGGYSAFQAGITFLPVTIIMFIFSSRFGALAGRFGPRILMGLGPLVASVGFLWMLSMGQTINYWTQLLPGILLFGLGLSMTVAPLTAAVLGSIHKAQAGIGSAINNAISRIAGLIAIAMLGPLLGTTLTVDGFRQGLLITAILLIVGGIVSLIGIQNHPTSQSS